MAGGSFAQALGVRRGSGADPYEDIRRAVEDFHDWYSDLDPDELEWEVPERPFDTPEWREAYDQLIRRLGAVSERGRELINASDARASRWGGTGAEATLVRGAGRAVFAYHHARLLGEPLLTDDEIRNLLRFFDELRAAQNLPSLTPDQQPRQREPMSNLTELLAADAALSAGDRELCARQIGEALTRVQTNRWEVEEAARALTASNPALCRRYLSKALERVRCMYCHGELDDERRYRPHFEGFVHLDCAERYDGRGDYLRQHPDERDR